MPRGAPLVFPLPGGGELVWDPHRGFSQSEILAWAGAASVWLAVRYLLVARYEMPPFWPRVIRENRHRNPGVRVVQLLVVFHGGWRPARPERALPVSTGA